MQVDYYFVGTVISYEVNTYFLLQQDVAELDDKMQTNEQKS